MRTNYKARVFVFETGDLFPTTTIVVGDKDKLYAKIDELIMNGYRVTYTTGELTNGNTTNETVIVEPTEQNEE